MADGVKFIFKEDPLPANVDRVGYFIAPFITLMLALTSLAVIPFGPQRFTVFGYETHVGIADVNISLLVLFAITALSVYGVALAGWASINEYSLLGGLRRLELGDGDRRRPRRAVIGRLHEARERRRRSARGCVELGKHIEHHAGRQHHERVGR